MTPKTEGHVISLFQREQRVSSLGHSFFFCLTSENPRKLMSGAGKKKRPLGLKKIFGPLLHAGGRKKKDHEQNLQKSLKIDKMLGCMPVIRKGITKCLLITLLPTKYSNSLEKTDPSWTEI